MMGNADCGARPAHVKILSVEHQIAIARAKKARLLADVLIASNFSSQAVREMNTEEWAIVARCAGCLPPHSEETILTVIWAVEVREKLEALRRSLLTRLAVKHTLKGEGNENAVAP